MNQAPSAQEVDPQGYEMRRDEKIEHFVFDPIKSSQYDLVRKGIDSFTWSYGPLRHNDIFRIEEIILHLKGRLFEAQDKIIFNEDVLTLLELGLKDGKSLSITDARAEIKKTQETINSIHEYIRQTSKGVGVLNAVIKYGRAGGRGSCFGLTTAIC